jgi:hypothetical protein
MVAGIPTTETVTQDMGDMGMVKPLRAPGDNVVVTGPTGDTNPSPNKTVIFKLPSSQDVEAGFQIVGQSYDKIFGMIGWTPFADQNRRTGLGANNPILDTASTRRDSAISEYNSYMSGRDWAHEKKTLDTTAKLNTNEKGLWTGTQESLDLYNSQSKSFNEAGLQGKELFGKIGASERSGVSSGAFVYQNGVLIKNPDLERPYGAASDWSTGASNVLVGVLGIKSREQFAAYDVARLSQPEIKTSPGSGIVGSFIAGERQKFQNLENFGYGAIKQVAMHPGSIVADVGSGIILYAATAGVGGIVGTAAQSTGRVGITARAVETIGASSVVTYGVPTAFVAGGVWQATEGFTLPANKAAMNVGGMSVELGAMAAGAAAPGAGRYIYNRIPETTLLQSPIRPGLEPVVRAGPHLVVQEIADIPITPEMTARVGAAKTKLSELESKGIGFESKEYTVAYRESTPYYHQKVQWSKNLDVKQFEIEKLRSISGEGRPSKIDIEYDRIMESRAREAILQKIDVQYKEMKMEDARTLQEKRTYGKMRQEVQRDIPLYNIAQLDLPVVGETPHMIVSAIQSRPLNTYIPRSKVDAGIDLTSRSSEAMRFKQGMSGLIEDRSLYPTGDFFTRTLPLREVKYERANIHQPRQKVAFEMGGAGTSDFVTQIPSRGTVRTKSEFELRYPFAAERLKSRSQRIAEQMGYERVTDIYGRTKTVPIEVSKSPMLYAQDYPNIVTDRILQREKIREPERMRTVSPTRTKTLETTMDRSILKSPEIMKESTKEREITKQTGIYYPERTKTIDRIISPEIPRQREIIKERPPYEPDPIKPIILIPGLPLLPSGGSSSPFGRKRRYNFMEVFNMGLDMSGPIMTAPRGMKPPRVKRSSLPGGRQKVKVSKKKR